MDGFSGGPISVAEYTEEVSMNPKFGFYINRDAFGVERDFITSPEVSQMFGEVNELSFEYLSNYVTWNLETLCHF
jgi:NADH dehydrogenase [ubiquinone] 1 alpha subcomplex assembly factor 7